MVMSLFERKKLDVSVEKIDSFDHEEITLAKAITVIINSKAGFFVNIYKVMNMDNYINPKPLIHQKFT